MAKPTEIEERFDMNDSGAIDVEAKRRYREQRDTVKRREKSSETPKQTDQQNDRDIDAERTRLFRGTARRPFRLDK